MLQSCCNAGLEQDIILRVTKKLGSAETGKTLEKIPLTHCFSIRHHPILTLTDLQLWEFLENEISQLLLVTYPHLKHLKKFLS